MTTLKDTAERAGVSIATVSRVLNHDKTFSIADDTRQLIWKTAEELQYYNGSRSTRRLVRFALIVLHTELDELEDPYYLSIRVNIRNEASLRSILVDEYFADSSLLNTALLSSYNGLIVLGSTHSWSQEMANCVLGAERPVVFTDFWTDELRHDCVYVDFRDLVKTALKHLIDMGYHKIGYIGGRERSLKTGEFAPDLRERYFTEYLRLENRYLPEYVFTGDATTCDTGYRLAQKAAADGCLPDAFFVTNDSMAIGALRALREAGVRVPEDVAVIGCNDIPAAAYLSPTLSTVRLRTDIMGIMAVRLLHDRIQQERDMGVRLVVPSELVVRDSSCRNQKQEVDA